MTQDAAENPLMHDAVPDMMRLLIVAFVGDDPRRQVALLASIQIDKDEKNMSMREIARQSKLDVNMVARDRREFLGRMALGEQLVPRAAWLKLMRLED